MDATAQAHPDPEQLAAVARSAASVLAEIEDPAAFRALLELSRHVGECLGLSARNLAAAQSWAGVASCAGTSRQAAWSRWAEH